MNSSDYNISDFRVQAERARLEAEQRRTQALFDQRSHENPPEVRVRIWERLHQLRMPKDPAHAILTQIAKQTHLELAEVQEVQRLRAAGA
jgi:hypothetical protein